MGNCQNFSVKNDPIKNSKVNQNDVNCSLTIKGYTWSRDSHGLFDYESKNVSQCALQIPNTGNIIRDKQEIKYVKQAQKITREQYLMGFLINENTQFILYSVLHLREKHEERSLQEQYGLDDDSIWMVIKSFKQVQNCKGYELQQNDYLQFGRVRFRIKELVSDDAEKEKTIMRNPNLFQFNSEPEMDILDINIDIFDVEQQNIQKEFSQKISCRICLSDTEDEENPLVTCCNCIGTVKYLHIQCLQRWLSNKVHPKQTTSSVSFVLQPFQCEICKSSYPNSVKLRDKVYPTVQVPKPSIPYITLEILGREKNVCQGVHILSMLNKPVIKLGRGHDADIRITDISVSRMHATFKYEKGIFFVEDNNSKFGSLVLMKEPLVLKPENSNIALQIGRSVTSFIVKRNWKILSVCLGSNQIPDKSNLPIQQQMASVKVEEIENQEMRNLLLQQGVLNHNPEVVDEEQNAANLDQQMDDNIMEQQQKKESEQHPGNSDNEALPNAQSPIINGTSNHMESNSNASPPIMSPIRVEDSSPPRINGINENVNNLMPATTQNRQSLPILSTVHKPGGSDPPAIQKSGSTASISNKIIKMEEDKIEYLSNKKKEEMNFSRSKSSKNIQKNNNPDEGFSANGMSEYSFMKEKSPKELSTCILNIKSLSTRKEELKISSDLDSIANNINTPINQNLKEMMTDELTMRNLQSEEALSQFNKSKMLKNYSGIRNDMLESELKKEQIQILDEENKQEGCEEDDQYIGQSLENQESMIASNIMNPARQQTHNLNNHHEAEEEEEEEVIEQTCLLDNQSSLITNNSCLVTNSRPAPAPAQRI